MARNVQFYILVLFAVGISTDLVNGSCNPNFGPAGGTECFLASPHYSKYQWGTCVTDTYLRTISKGKHRCRGEFTTYCDYQCMLESHGIEEGPVYDDCACVPDAVASTSSPRPGTTTTTLPDWCYSPDGTTCTWYIICLEKRNPCFDIDNQGSAVQYALKFCNLHSESQQHFSDQGQRWINAVRECLQVELVRIMRPYVQMTCEEIENFAIETHSPCYLHPYPDEPSICDLGLTDWAKVFWTIKGGFVDATSPSLEGMINVTSGCAQNVLESVLEFVVQTYESGMRLIKLIVENNKQMIGRKSLSEEYDDVANSIGKQLADQLHWKQNGVQWFVFVGNGSNTDEIGFNILLGSKSMYDVNAVGVPEANMNKTVDDLADAIGSGELYLNVGKNLKVKQFNACLDFDCQETYHDVIPKLKAFSDGTAVTSTLQVLVTTLICATLLH